MVWQDLLLDRWIDEPMLVRALATVFDVDSAAVAVVDDIAAPSLEVERIVVLTEQTRRQGQFPLQLSVYLRDDAVWQRVRTFSETLGVVHRLCSLVHSSCLITGEAEHADEDFLIRPNGDIVRVTLDEDRRDDDEFVVVASEPFEPLVARISD